MLVEVEILKDRSLITVSVKLVKGFVFTRINVFEVKTRTSFNYGFPSEAVNKNKQNHILRCAKYYLYCNKLEDYFVRIDVIEVVVDMEKNRYKLNHLKGVL